ncbi:MAG: DNA-3-methyladenine glycosylase [Sandaracinaceae bacterium]
MSRVVTLPGPLDMKRTLGRLTLALGDPTTRVDGGAHWFAFHTEAGPASVRYEQRDSETVEVDAFGPGAEVALASAGAHLGADDRPESFRSDHPVVAPLIARFDGLRFGRSGRVLERLVPAILGQKVTGKGAARSWRELVWATSERAPGPVQSLWLPPTAAQLRRLAYQDFHPFGVERKRAMIILSVVRRAKTLERLATADPELAWSRLNAFHGIGPWTAANVLSGARGDADLVPVGDYHFCHMVVHAFTGKDRGSDDEMMELLAPFAPHRGRVVAMLMAAGVSAPRFGPRMPVRDIRKQ